MQDLLQFEKEYFKKGLTFLCGVDEAGRGPLAGPVAAAAVIPDFTYIIKGVNDSKKLSDAARRRLYPEIAGSAAAYKTCMIDAETIERINILEATKLAMTECVSALLPVPELVLIDAVKLNLPVPSVSVIHGDAVSYSIAAASILAKVERDDLMNRYAGEYPEYGFEVHKGYGTKYHIEMIKKYGPCPIHRRLFLRKILGE